MTKDELYFKIQAEIIMNFKFQGNTYRISYDKDSKGVVWIVFGTDWDSKRYSSYGEFINDATIDNYFFRELLEDLTLSS